MPSLIQRIKNLLQREPAIPPDPARFIAHNLRRWPRRTATKPGRVLLLGIFSHEPTVFAFSTVANLLAERAGAELAAYSFGDTRRPVIEEIFDSFGAAMQLTLADGKPHRARAAQLTAEIVRGLRSKWDVMNIAVEGVIIGDLIYDTYLRYLLRPTVDVASLELRQIIEKAVLIFLTCRDYFATHEVVAVIPDHTVYIESGILARLALKARIPVYLVTDCPLAVIELANDLGAAADYTMWPPRRKPHHRYRELFARLTPEQQAAGLERAQAALSERLSGRRDDSVLPGMSAYAPASTERITADAPEPRMLVMMHDFCDAAHVYQSMLFPDFEEWITFLLERAEQTPFRWYVKPHPNTAFRDRKDEINREVVAGLQRRFPKITFLDPKTSNAQLITEGISAMFTVFGTAAHEFAYLGIPAVTAGDNPHTDYGFNFHPKTLAEYEALIRGADRLQIEMPKRDIEEFYYMNYLYFWDDSPASTRQAATGPGYGPMLDRLTPETEREVAAYVDRFLAAPR